MSPLTSTPLVLVDMDGVLVDLEAAFWDAFETAHPAGPRRTDGDRTVFRIDEQLDPQWRDAVRSIMAAPGFFGGLRPVPGAVEALDEMLDEGWDVRICTAPLLHNPTCASDKLASLARHFGQRWAERAVITKDKTLVRGDVLIDDKPVVNGDWTPVWKHVVFAATYNQAAPSPYRLTGWASWRQTLTPLLGRTAA
ncbi:hypothetical protein J1G43_05420 [Cellulomonas sp. zg-ZUI22]|uniref:5' nucleotidase, NT5C type n=1 Tax=Cellulomonas sp. zg-ZUI22 TaxID=2816955 RepID=UPI001A945445|nr:hypothetical protein [Cellulomonas sp. zg-ZUI22]MBO0899400.1 hypothetical protein [Cellulomonas sp. zg-ZUI22]